MLEQMLKMLFESDSKAASGSGSERIKADVLSRIESEKPMKHIRIKPLIVAAAVTVVGLMSVVLTVNASMDAEVMEEISRAAEDPVTYKKAEIDYSQYAPEDREAFKKFDEIQDREQEIMKEYMDGKIISAMENGGITVEKKLDETDVVGFVPPRYSRFTGAPTEDELEYVKLIEEDPESLGLTPIGKSETFAGGLRIVNRHYENKNEFKNGEKVYYSFRRIYTDDSENRLLASTYIGFTARFLPEDPNQKVHYLSDSFKTVLSVFLDHTENGCIADPEKSRSTGGALSTNGSLSTDGTKLRANFHYWYFKSNTTDRSSDIVPVGCIIAVTEDGTQWLD